jgi:hypothetical protein
MLSSAIGQALNLYKSRGHKVEEVEFLEYEHPVHNILADNEFEMLREDIEGSGVRVNIMAKEEHVPEVECRNWPIKERARAIIQTLPYKVMPKRTKTAIMQYVIYWLNVLLNTDQEYLPRDLIIGEQKLDYKSVCQFPFRAYVQVQFPFRAYVQVHDDLDITNMMESRAIRAINLESTGNIQGTHRYLILKTGEMLSCRQWKEFPVPSDFI